MAPNKTKTIRVWMSTYERIQNLRGIPPQINSDAARIDFVLDLADGTPTSNALNDICKLLDVPDRDYPGQVVRDVAKAIGMSLDDMAIKLMKADEKVDA